MNRPAPTDLKHGVDIQRDIEEVDRGPADEEDQTDSNQDVVCPSSSGHLPYQADVWCLAVGLNDWKGLADFVVDQANDNAWYEVLDEKASDGVEKMVVHMGSDLNIVENDLKTVKAQLPHSRMRSPHLTKGWGTPPAW